MQPPPLCLLHRDPMEVSAPHQGPGQLAKSETSSESGVWSHSQEGGRAGGGAGYLPLGPGRAQGSQEAVMRVWLSGGAEPGMVGKPPAGKATAEGKKAWVRRQRAPQ